jgi:hypothetical protein
VRGFDVEFALDAVFFYDLAVDAYDSTNGVSNVFYRFWELGSPEFGSWKWHPDTSRVVFILSLPYCRPSTFCHAVHLQYFGIWM